MERFALPRIAHCSQGHAMVLGMTENCSGGTGREPPRAPAVLRLDREGNTMALHAKHERLQAAA